MINQNKMTAVEQLIDQLTSIGVLEIPQGSNAVTYIIEQAKEMEKEQMLNAFQESRLTHPMIGFKHETFLDYYNQTFKSE